MKEGRKERKEASQLKALLDKVYYLERFCVLTQDLPPSSAPCMQAAEAEKSHWLVVELLMLNAAKKGRSDFL